MSLLIPDGDVEPTSSGISRRRILQGVAWGTPAVIIATAAPAAAASTPRDPRTLPPVQLPSGTGMEVTNFTAKYDANRWNETLGAKIKAVNTSLYIQNKGNTAPATGTVILTLIIPVGTQSNPIWGIGNGNGIPSGEPWTLASGPTVSSGKATITLVYTGAPMGPWAGVSVSNLWVQANGNVNNQVATAVVNATYQGNFTSIHTATDPV